MHCLRTPTFCCALIIDDSLGWEKQLNSFQIKQRMDTLRKYLCVSLPSLRRSCARLLHRLWLRWLPLTN